ncbi:hypothetical protein HPP92_015063 [Vanilla planifolia]|uniref:Fe2OG dioxygenase domain-containing protein n=1 Tax=Vanilla planifolia TaxID=51239 RepID=A0A835QX25_VANPL|nr:hypothetical protein HPP92_015063 [Vanilla planifolia]
MYDWPEPVVSVQSLADGGISVIPERYIKPPEDRPATTGALSIPEQCIPVVDLAKLSKGSSECPATILSVANACREWGLFQVVNHGVEAELMTAVMATWREFFKLPLEEKRKLANSPTTYEGYGSLLGVEKGASLDWGDYFFLYILPSSHKNHDKWPNYPPSCREITEEYGRQMVALCGNVMKVLSKGLGLEVGFLQEKFGGDEIGACLRVNYYPKCPQPDLTLGLSAHSDPGGLTVLLADDRVPGLQVRKGASWITVHPVTGAFVINIGDQIQVLSNAEYKSLEHRVLASETKERMSVAFFYNPRADLLLEPARELVTKERPQRYDAMTFTQYRLHIRNKGPSGKTQLESLQIT